jgi:hypothetical protein
MPADITLLMPLKGADTPRYCWRCANAMFRNVPNGKSTQATANAVEDTPRIAPCRFLAITPAAASLRQPPRYDAS